MTIKTLSEVKKLLQELTESIEIKEEKTHNKAILFAEWLSINEWVKRNNTHPKNVGKYWSDIHCEYRSIEILYVVFDNELKKLTVNK